MLFNSFTFVVFFIVTLAIYYNIKNWKSQKWLLLIASYFFYGIWNPPFTLILFYSTYIDWIAGKKIHESTDLKKRRFWLWISLLGNLGVLIYFKYGGFLLENFNLLISIFGVHLKYSPPNIILPLGISFYTFQTMSYTLDIYKKNIKPAKTLLDFAFFVTFFPQLVAGPIVRAADFLPQCETPKKTNKEQFSWGIYLLTLGLFQKIVLADFLLSPVGDTLFRQENISLSKIETFLTVLASGAQIYFDFSGYSTCAIGTALCFGFSLKDNFRFPFGSVGFFDLWRRWHISLSTLLKDYIYNPHGNFFNFMGLMFIVGLWHGASWAFILWGLLHGLVLSIEKFLKSKFGYLKLSDGKFLNIVFTLITVFLCCFIAVFFKAKDSQLAFKILLGMVKRPLETIPQSLASIDIFISIIIFSLLMITHKILSKTTLENSIVRIPNWIILFFWSIMLIGIILSQGENDAFIYFKF